MNADCDSLQGPLFSIWTGSRTQHHDGGDNPGGVGMCSVPADRKPWWPTFLFIGLAFVTLCNAGTSTTWCNFWGVVERKRGEKVEREREKRGTIFLYRTASNRQYAISDLSQSAFKMHTQVTAGALIFTCTCRQSSVFSLQSEK